jgi:nicotinate-nucleotide pyrophosphorylase (carboxylating)
MTLEDDIDKIINNALLEDIRSGDITCEACIDPDQNIEGEFILKESAVLAGLCFLPRVFQKLNPCIEVVICEEEGKLVPSGTVVAKIKGPAREILTAERVALNLVQHACGVATMTNHFVEKVKPYPCDILDTRKTLPGLRALEKYAVRTGGGKNHRFALDDRFLIKDNHLAFLAKKGVNPILTAVEKARNLKKECLIEVEIDLLDQLEDVIKARPDIIMLDNMLPKTVEKAVKEIDGRAYVEASGGITLDTVRAYAHAGVDGVSVGALTHSVTSIDISLELTILV